MTQKERKELFNQGLKKCSKCGVVKSLDEFSNDKTLKDGKHSSCRECDKKYYKNHKEEISEYQKNNKEKIAEYLKEYRKNNIEKKVEYRKNNKEKIKECTKKYNQSFSKSKKRFKELSKYEDVKLDKDGYIQVKCKKCNEYFIPSNSQIYSRIACINGTGTGECNFYCSDECKDTCEIFKKRITPGLEQFDIRELQGEWAKAVKEIDNYTCQICGSDKDLHAHHIEAHAVTYDSFDIDNGITLCINCHHSVHQLPGCTLGDIKKQKQNCGV